MPYALSEADRLLHRYNETEGLAKEPPDLPVDQNVPRVCKNWVPLRTMIGANHKAIEDGKIWW
jgi:hypothetical protein